MGVVVQSLGPWGGDSSCRATTGGEGSAPAGWSHPPVSCWALGGSHQGKKCSAKSYVTHTPIAFQTVWQKKKGENLIGIFISP